PLKLIVAVCPAPTCVFVNPPTANVPPLRLMAVVEVVAVELCRLNVLAVTRALSRTVKLIGPGEACAPPNCNPLLNARLALSRAVRFTPKLPEVDRPIAHTVPP